ncbi:MAG: hypothetical protein NT077_02600 [Candidatus Taylorbacteria bacterium]|nr:hypothetical protein [Candidatus Taylorbacteria bacterium]
MIAPAIKRRAVELRMAGMSYDAISNALGLRIPKSTFWYWFKDLKLSNDHIKRMRSECLSNLTRARDELIAMFLQLLRKCYTLDEEKFRCTVMCRADQDIAQLQNFWSGITHIPLMKFYRATIDQRTIGKPTRKPDYKGVCRINYFSAMIAKELCQIPKLLF